MDNLNNTLVTENVRKALKGVIKDILISEGYILENSKDKVENRSVELEALYSSISAMFIRKGPSGNGLLTRKQLLEITKHMLEIKKIMGVK